MGAWWLAKLVVFQDRYLEAIIKMGIFPRFYFNLIFIIFLVLYRTRYVVLVYKYSSIDPLRASIFGTLV